MLGLTKKTFVECLLQFCGLLLTVATVLASGREPQISIDGVYSAANAAILVNTSYVSSDACKVVTANCSVGTLDFSCSCDQRQFQDEINTRRCMHSAPDADAMTFDFRAISWSDDDMSLAQAIVEANPTTSSTIGHIVNSTRTYIYSTAGLTEPEQIIDSWYSLGPSRIPYIHLLFSGVHTFGCFAQNNLVACIFQGNNTADPCEPRNDQGIIDGCDDCNTIGAAECPPLPKNPDYNYATCLSAARGAYTSVKISSRSSADADNTLSDAAIVMIAIFGSIILIGIVSVQYWRKRILHWCAPFRPTEKWMQDETKANNIAMAKHTTHVKLKRESLHAQSHGSLRHRMAMPEFNPDFNVDPIHPHDPTPSEAKAAHEHIPKLFQPRIFQSKTPSTHIHKVQTTRSTTGRNRIGALNLIDETQL